MARQKLLFIAAALALIGLVVWRFPLFHLVPLKEAERQQKAGEFDAAKVATDFWVKKLMPAMEQAVDLNELMSALKKNTAEARKRYGRALGLGGATLFLVRGSGKINEVEEDAVVVAIEGTGAKVSLSTGLLFGNTVRDASGLLDVSAYPNSQDFNALSTQLNRLVETRVTPALRRQAKVGKGLRFAGCAELEEDAKAELVTVIPIKIEWP